MKIAIGGMQKNLMEQEIKKAWTQKLLLPMT